MDTSVLGHSWDPFKRDLVPINQSGATLKNI